LCNLNLKAWFAVVQRVVKVLIKLKLVFGCLNGNGNAQETGLRGDDDESVSDCAEIGAVSVLFSVVSVNGGTRLHEGRNKY